MRSASTFPLGAGDVWRLRAQHVALLLLLAASAALAWDSYEEHRSFAVHTQLTARQTATEAAGSLIRPPAVCVASRVWRSDCQVLFDAPEVMPG